MEKYTAIYISNEHIGQGALSHIQDLANKQFFESGEWAVQNRHLNPAEYRVSMVFDASLGGAYVDDGMVLFANEEGLRVVKESGVEFRVVQEAAVPPTNYGNMLNLVVWR